MKSVFRYSIESLDDFLSDIPEGQPQGSQHSSAGPEIGLVDTLPFATKQLIKNGADKGDRSEATASVLASMVKAGIPEVDIISTFESEPIGEKFREKIKDADTKGLHKFFDEFQVMKVFKHEYVENTDLNDVVNEGQILTRLSHPNVVKVFEINTFNKKDVDHYFITMSFVSGESLSQLVRRKIQLDTPVASSIMIDVLKGLASAHNNNPSIIHRDINPDNILLSYDEGKPIGILGDFGIANSLRNKLATLLAKQNFQNLNSVSEGPFVLGITLFFAAISIIIAYFADKPKN